MAVAGVKIKGDKKLLAMLRQLPKKAVAVNRRAINVGTTPILRAVKAGVPVDHGDLKQSMIKKVSNHGPNCSGIVGADADYVGENGEKPAKYDHLVEFGHVATDGTQVSANPFMRNGWDEGYPEAQEKYEAALKAGIEKAAEAAK
jgi:HK97 gp10 family phage protein